MQFGISTHLYHDQRLALDHLSQIAGYGFEGIELFATRSHFDYHDAASLDALAGWLSQTRLHLFSVHAPITDSFGAGDQWAPTYSNAVAGNARRQAAVQDRRGAGDRAACAVPDARRAPRHARQQEQPGRQ
jgi:esterase/lipase superfamily enzyme